MNYWANLEYSNENGLAGSLNRTLFLLFRYSFVQISEKDRIRLDIPTMSWEDEPIKIELDIQAMVINQ